MKILDPALLAEFRAKPRCEVCARFIPGSAEPHHIFARGRSSAFRMDLRENLIALCRCCHAAVHAGNLLRCDLLAIVARREGRLQTEIEEELKRLRWAPKEGNTRE